VIKVGDIVSCACGCGLKLLEVIEIKPRAHNEVYALSGGSRTLFDTKNLVIENLTRLERIVYGFHTEEK
jgi:hypothetical protein